MTKSPFANVALATAGFCLLHSGLASRTVKSLAERLLGTRRRNALYRPAFNLIALLTSGALAKFLLRQPKHTLYHFQGPAAALFRTGQLASLAAFAAATYHAHPLRLSGLPSLAAFLTSKPSIPREPEAQSPEPFPDGRFHPTGPFRFSRQPLNFFPIPLLCLQPHMTSRFAAFAAVASLYFYLGSHLSESRLQHRYGPAYAAYQHGGTPFFLPRLTPRSSTQPSA